MPGGHCRFTERPSMPYPNLESLVREFNIAYTQGADAIQRFREKHGLVKPTEIAHGDYETRGVVELRKSGVHVYASHKDTDAWCLDYAFDDEAVEEWVNWPLLNRDELALYLGKSDAERAPLGPSVHQYLESGARPPLPERLVMHIISGGEFHGHNVGFEWHIWNLICVPRYGWPALPIEQCYCTAAMAAAMSMPRSLEDVAIALRLQEQKDKAGSRVMMQLAKPRRVEADGTLVWWTDPAKHATLHSYCKQDVVVEREVEKKLRPLSPMERKVWLLDFKINQRGVRVDLPLVKAAQRVVKRATERLNFQMGKVTDGQVTACTQAGALVGWLGTLGVQTESIDKEAVLALLDRPDLPPKARQAVLLRQEAAKASTAKLTAMQNSVSPDGRVRGMFLYHGAGTGRWCLAEGSLVLVKASDGTVTEKPIESVRLDDLVWDGLDWVEHDGVVFSGEKRVIEHDGVRATPEHIVFVSDDRSMPLAKAKGKGLPLLQMPPAMEGGE